MSDPYRSDGDAQELVREHLERENDALVLENRGLRARVIELEADAQRLVVIARDLLNPIASERMTIARADVVAVTRALETERAETKKIIRHAVIVAAASFIAYELLLRAL